MQSLPLLADAAALLAGFFLLPALAAQMAAPSTMNVIILTAAFVLYCIAVYLIRKLEPAGGRVPLPEALLRPLTMRVLAVLFALAFAALILAQFGYWDLIFVVDDRVLGAGESSAFFVYGPGAWIGASLFYVLVLSASVRVTIRQGQANYSWLALLGLLGINGMLLLVTAVLQPLWSTGNLPTGLAGFLPALLLLTLLFAPPRIWYLVKRPSRLSLASFVLVLIIFAGLLVTG